MGENRPANDKMGFFEEEKEPGVHENEKPPEPVQDTKHIPPNSERNVFFFG